MIEFNHVTKIYDKHSTALNNISIFIEKGEFVFLMGPSGAGKTTLLKHIYVDEKPTKGQVIVCGNDSKLLKKHQIPHLRRRIGIIFQDYKLLHDRDVFENIAFCLRVQGLKERKIKRRVYETLALTGLSHKYSYLPSQLSGGEQQRLCIARAVSYNPDVVIADEPTGNLDYEVSDEIFNLLKKINSWGTTVIMSTHNENIVNESHFRRIVLKNGTLSEGSNRSIKKNFVEWY